MRVVSEVRTYCKCGAELFSAADWSAHRRRHTLEYYGSTPEGQRILRMLHYMGFKNQPDQPAGAK